MKGDWLLPIYPPTNPHAAPPHRGDQNTYTFFRPSVRSRAAARRYLASLQQSVFCFCSIGAGCAPLPTCSPRTSSPAPAPPVRCSFIRALSVFECLTSNHSAAESIRPTAWRRWDLRIVNAINAGCIPVIALARYPAGATHTAIMPTVLSASGNSIPAAAAQRARPPVADCMLRRASFSFTVATYRTLPKPERLLSSFLQLASSPLSPASRVCSAPADPPAPLVPLTERPLSPILRHFALRRPGYPRARGGHRPPPRNSATDTPGPHPPHAGGYPPLPQILLFPGGWVGVPRVSREFCRAGG